MRLYVARHGQTLWNAQRRVCGSTDLPLTQEGLAQAEALAQRVRDLKIDRILVSPLMRARQTAAAVEAATGLTAVVEPRLREQNFGQREGVDWGDEGFLCTKRNLSQRHPGGESTFDVVARVYGLLDELAANAQPEEGLLLVCHGCVARAIRSYFESLTEEEYLAFSLENAQLMEYRL